MTEVRTLLLDAAERLHRAGVASPDHDAAELLAHALGTVRGRLVLATDVDETTVAAFHGLVSRREAREPLQHLTGIVGFRYLELQVGPGVFVPRPETELLAGWAVEAAQELVSARLAGQDAVRPVVVDLGTGSGAIALSVATEVPDTVVHAVEVDPGAHAWAERNLAHSAVSLHLADLADALPELTGSVDVVVSNPPYIPLDAWESVAAEARDHDPAAALWSSDDGLDAMRALERTAARLLRPGGVVGAEHADVQGESAPAVFTATGRWTEVRDHADLSGRDRFVTARLAR